MLPAKNRLTKKKDFEEVHRYGDFFSFGTVALKVKKSNVGYARVGVAVGLKFSKKAVARNAMKRKLRALAGIYLPSISGSCDLVLMAKRMDKIESDSSKLRRDFENSLKKAGLIDKK
jgi:ribonuclease P protein component